jgi:hypothetical protein
LSRTYHERWPHSFLLSSPDVASGFIFRSIAAPRV